MLNLPQTWIDLYRVLANPLTFGILISMILGKFKFMAKDSTTKAGTPIPAWFKMLVVIVCCLIWSIAVTVYSPDGFVWSSASLYNILLMTFTVTLSTQIWHEVVSPLIDQIIQILFGVGVTLKARAEAIRLHG